MPYRWEIAIKNVVELLAAIPSVVWGFIGLKVMSPVIISVFHVPVGVNLFNAALLLAAGVALAFLSKGLVGILIPAAVAGIYMLLRRDWSLPWRAQPW